VYDNNIGYDYKRKDIVFEPLWAGRNWWRKPVTIITGKMQRSHVRHKHEEMCEQYKKKIKSYSTVAAIQIGPPA
jgi:hypothetical protein